MGRRVGFESWVERGHLVALDFDPAVTAIVSQPFWLHWRTLAGKARRHSPDFFARLAGGGGLVIDSRPQGVAGGGDREAFTVTARVCELLGWDYAVCGPMDPVVAANLDSRCGSCVEILAGRRFIEVGARPLSLIRSSCSCGRWWRLERVMVTVFQSWAGTAASRPVSGLPRLRRVGQWTSRKD
jgi:hypothetical protein